MTENEILTRLLKTKDPNFAKSVLRGTVAGASDRAKMEAWLVVVERLGTRSQAAQQYLPTEQMLSAYQTATGKNPLASLDDSEKRALIGPLGEQYGDDNARRMLGLAAQSTPPAAEPEPEKTEGGYADYVDETKTETTPTPEATVPPDTEDDTGNYADAITGDVDPVWDEIKRNALGQVNDPNLPGHAKMQLWRELAEQYGMDAANSIFVPTDEMAWSYEQDRGENPWAGFEYGEPGSYKKYVESKIENSDPEFEPQGEVVPSTDFVSGELREETIPSATPDVETESGDVGDGLLTPSTDKVTGTPPTVEVSEENPSYSFEGGNIGDDTGDEFDEKLKKNEEIANLNIREGAMTYEEWMKSDGIDTQRDYNAAAKAAAKEYDRSLGTYGATAEAMGRAGLSGSGYSDYLTGNAYATRQRSMDSARQTKTLADDASRQGYMKYLQDYEDGQRGDIAAAIGELSAMGLSGDKAKQYLSMMGIDAGYADYVVGIVDEMAAEGDPDKQALLTEILSNNLSGDAAMSYAKFLGFDDATAAEVIGMADQLSAAGKTAQADALRASVYANLLSTGLMGDDAIYYATEIAGMDPEAAKALVAMTDAVLEKQAAAEAAAEAAKAKSELGSITVDVPKDDIKSLRSLYKNASAQSESGAGMIGVSELAIFPVAERVAIQQDLNSISDPVARTEKLLKYIADHYLLEGYTEPEVEKILSLVEGGV